MYTRIVIENFANKSVVTYEGDRLTYPIAEIQQNNIVIDNHTNKQVLDLVIKFLFDIAKGLKQANLT